jgi:iron complex outermembrane recepter protein
MASKIWERVTQLPRKNTTYWTLTALGGVLSQSVAFAQTSASVQKAENQSLDVLEEIVVTATRQTDTLNKVPLSITALTNESLEQQGINTVQDVARVVPELTIRYTDNNALNPQIRGIVSTAGAPTTGVYLDDTALQKRAGAGSAVGNGTPFPALFDLERIEVLRGPQGTLFGGSSEGGTIRFITPEPSLTTHSVYSKLEAGAMTGGDPSYEGGIAVGGPIIDDRLGFRVSVYDQYIGGNLDHINQYSRQDVFTNTNSDTNKSARGALAWMPIDSLKVTGAVFWSKEDLADASPFWLNQPAVTTPARYYSATSATPTLTPTATTVYTYPSHTYGPYGFYGPGEAGGNYKSPAHSSLLTPTLTTDLDFGGIQLKDILSYVRDTSSGVSAFDPSTDVPSLQAGVPYVAELPDFAALFDYTNTRHGFSEEVRATTDASKPFSIVGGLYFSRFETHSFSQTLENLDQLTMILEGLPAKVRFGASMLPGNVASSRDQNIEQREAAAYAQADWRVTDALKLTAGVRASDEHLHYTQTVDGPVGGFDLTRRPTTANGGIVDGTEDSRPATPKAGIQYDLTSDDIVYFTASKGFREGGVNTTLPTSCNAVATAAGFPKGAPATFDPDTLWSYELGTKLKLFNDRMQLNVSGYYIDWSKIQFSVTIPGCAFPFVTNAAKAVSKGFDVQGSLLLVHGLTAEFAAASDDAHYTSAVFAPGSTTSKLLNEGDTLATPKWNANLGAQYKYQANGYSIYLRSDYEWKSSYLSGTGPGTTSYQPDIYNIPSTKYVTARMGVNFSAWDISLFAKNLTNSQDILGYNGINSGRYGCSAASGAACSTFTSFNPVIRAVTYRPREIGLTAAFRY